MVQDGEEGQRIFLARNQEYVACLNDKLKSFGYSGNSNGNLDETCEREVAPEVEDQKQVSKPPRPPAATVSDNQALEKFITSGIITKDSTGFESASTSLQRTTLAGMPAAEQCFGGLLLTRSFAKALDTLYPMDSYQQNVAYVLHLKPEAVRDEIPQVAVLISQADLNKYRRRIRSSMVYLHLYNAKVTSEVASRGAIYLEPKTPNFTYSYPTAIRIALDLFAGQLFFFSFQQYMEVSSYLGLCYFSDFQDGKDIEVEPDGFIPPLERHKIPAWHCRPNHLWETFETSPVPFLKKFLGVVRGHGTSFANTQMGKMLNGEQLGEHEFGSHIKRPCEQDLAEAKSRAAKKPRLETKAQRDERLQTDAHQKGEQQEDTKSEGQDATTAPPPAKKQRTELTPAGRAAILRETAAQANPAPVIDFAQKMHETASRARKAPPTKTPRKGPKPSTAPTTPAAAMPAAAMAGPHWKQQLQPPTKLTKLRKDKEAWLKKSAELKKQDERKRKRGE